ncbi:hypothetical protein JXB41_06725, partial [Candidatus Woesearchaeota archaeon]|nr:hypothetical protein [Candidatus Woesearchaeota archaeon]
MSSCIIGNSAADITGQSITIDLEQLVDEVLVERKKGMLATIDNIIPEETSHLQSLELEKLQARREDAQRQLKYVCSLAGDDRIKA